MFSCYLRQQCLFLFFGLFLFETNAQQFIDRTDDFGLEFIIDTPFYIGGGGASMVDINQDGLDDLSFTRSNLPPSVRLSDGTGFIEQDFLSSVNIFPKSIMWVDIDNDGDLDFFATSAEGDLDMFERNDEGELVDRLLDSGIENDLREYTGATWADYDLDGDLDVFLPVYDGLQSPQRSNLFYRNDGGFQFTEVSAEAGLATENDLSFQASWIDLNHDLYPDLFLINDRSTGNRFYLNNTDGTFEDITDDVGIELNFDPMSTSWGDFNQDGILDLYITNSMSGLNDEVPNFLYLGQEDMSFVNVAEAYGVDLNRWTWGAAWIDIENDGDLDLYVTEYEPLLPQFEDHLFINQGAEGGYFLLEDNSLIENNDSIDSHCIAVGDHNNDGYVDFALTSNIGNTHRYYENVGGTNNYLKINLEGVISNKFGVGSWIDFWAGGILQRRYTFCGDNYLAQNSYTNLFGLGTSAQVDSVIVRWPSGVVDRLFDLEANETLLIVEGENYVPNPIPGQQIYNLCLGESLHLSYPFEDFVSWNTGDENNEITITAAGEYFVNTISPLGIEGISSSIEVNFFEPTPPSSELSQPTCFELNNGSITFDLIEGQLLFFEGEAIEGNTISNLGEGFLSVDVIDSLNCEQSFEFNLLFPPEIEASLPVYVPNCEGNYEPLFLGVQSGGTGSLEVEWNGLDADVVSPGEYAFSVTDEAACEAVFELSLDAFDLLSVNAEILGESDEEGGSIVLEASGGFPPYEILWATGEDSFTLNNLEAGSYMAVITDDLGCELGFETLITSIHAAEMFEVNLYPNPGQDDFVLEGLEGFNLTMVNMLGEKVLETSIHTNFQSIPSENLAAGRYFLQLRNASNLMVFPWVKE